MLTGFALVGTLLFAFLVTMVGAGVIGVVIERVALRPLRGVPGTAAMITTIGVSYILFNIVLLTAGASSENFPNPLPVIRWEIAGATLQLREVLIWGIAVRADAGAAAVRQPYQARQGDARDRAGPRGRTHDGRRCRPGGR